MRKRCPLQVSMRDTRWLLAFLVLARASEAVVLTPGSPVICIAPGREEEGQTQDFNECKQASAWNVGSGLLPNGSCTVCGNWPDGRGDSGLETLNCGPKYPAVRYVKGDWRYCGCNIGYYGNQTASGCKPCPEGTTTQGFGATGVQECNVCTVGYTGAATGTPGSCKPCSQQFKGPVTTAKAGNNQPCVCPQGFTGQPGNCKACVGYNVTTAFPGAQQCVCPAGGKPPFCKPCTEGVVLNDKCVCPERFTGVWPNCKLCASSISYKMTTYGPGNGNRCECMLTSDDDDYGNPGRSIDRDAATGQCVCRPGAGFYLKVAPNFQYNREEAQSTPCDGLGDNPAEDGKKLIQLNGQTRLGCDTSKGYGADVAYQTNGSPDYPICIKCNMTGAVINPVTTRCECKPGFGINPAYHGRYPAPYCIPCTSPNVTLGTFPQLLPAKDVLCRCNWEKGYAGALRNVYWEGLSRCARCPGPNMVVDQTTGSCVCAKGFVSLGVYVDPYYGEPPKKCIRPPKCKPGEEVDDYGSCVCKLFKTSSGSCVFPKPGCSQVTLSYWVGATSSDGKFPVAVLKTKPSSVLKLAPSAVYANPNLLGLVPAASRKNVAMALDGCFCSLSASTTVFEMTSVGSAALQTTELESKNVIGLETKAVLNQTEPHTSAATGYYGATSWGYPEDRCLAFKVTFYSNSAAGLLKLKTVAFPFTPFGF